MKKTTLLILFILTAGMISAQQVNEPANWPNANWSITGSYDSSSAVFTDNPTTSSSNFSFDDDEAGSSSVNNIAAESPVIDLTSAFNAGEVWINVSSSFILTIFQTETITIQYWDADASAWVNWGSPYDTNTSNSPTSNFCSATGDALSNSALNITGFSANQLSNFRYRIPSRTSHCHCNEYGI